MWPLKLKQNWEKIALAGLCLFLFLAYSWFPMHIWNEARDSGGHFIFSWPDETANYFFAKAFKESNSLAVPEILNSLVNNALHPRSFNIAGENLVPMGFIGLPLIFGGLAKIFGSGQIVFFTPLFSILGLLAFYGILKRFFDAKFSLLGVFLLGTLASWAYYSSVSMLSEIAFISLALCAFYFGLKAFDDNSIKKNIGFAGASGLLLALSLAIRTNEIFWIFWLLLIPLFVYRKKINWKIGISFAAAFLVPVIAVLIVNRLTYGEFLTLGYLKFGAEGSASLPTGITASGPLKYLKLFFAPFGFHPRLMWHNFINYYVVLFWPYFAMAALGAGAFIWSLWKKATTKAENVYFLSSLIAGVCVLIYYASMQITDPLVLRENTIGISYVRYFVPLILLTIPAMVYFIRWLTGFMANRWFTGSYFFLNAGLVVLFSFNLAYRTDGDGLISQTKIISEYYEQAETVKALVGDNQIIVTERSDKVFFPEQKVAVFDSDFSVFARLVPVLNSRKLYYFTMRNDKEINEMNAYKLQPLGMRAEFPVKIGDKFRLYELVWVPKGQTQ